MLCCDSNGCKMHRTVFKLSGPVPAILCRRRVPGGRTWSIRERFSPPHPPVFSPHVSRCGGDSGCGHRRGVRRDGFPASADGAHRNGHATATSHASSSPRPDPNGSADATACTDGGADHHRDAAGDGFDWPICLPLSPISHQGVNASGLNGRRLIPEPTCGDPHRPYQLCLQPRVVARRQDAGVQYGRGHLRRRSGRRELPAPARRREQSEPPELLARRDVDRLRERRGHGAHLSRRRDRRGRR